MSNWVAEVLARRLSDRKEKAITRAGLVLKHLAERGVQARVVGSLATGKFALHSDVDFLIEVCPREIKYSIESGVEDIMEDIPFDVIYKDEQK